MQTPNYSIPAYTALKSPTQEVQEAQIKPATLPPTSLKQAQTNYLLDKLQEESAEVIQAVSKIRRFGETSSHPDRKTNNHQELIIELEDLLAILAALEACGYFDLTPNQQNILAKTKALLK
jgi:NTP pyrophosphatase (non-canonical NTP hydrolase)